MYPSQVRERILKEHEQLHARLYVLEEAVDAMENDPERLETVVETARALLAEFGVHTEVEDQILGAALLEIDAWGPERARRLREHHEAQRSELRELAAAYEQLRSCDEVAQLTRRWICDVRDDMSQEESDMLTPTLLRDDPIAVAMEDG